jgi:hypothetical protein
MLKKKHCNTVKERKKEENNKKTRQYNQENKGKKCKR